MIEKASRRIDMRATPAELAAIDRKASAAGLTRSRFLLEAALSCEVHAIAFDAAPVREANRLLANATGNLNQVARRLNEYGLEPETLADVLDAMAEIDERVQATRAALNEALSTKGVLHDDSLVHPR